MIEVEIRADSKFCFNKDLLRVSIKQALKQFGIKGMVNVSISIVGSRKMRALNKKYRLLDQTTDVLSFPFEEAAKTQGKSQAYSQGFPASPDKVLYLGDIVVSYPEALDQAISQNTTVDETIIHLSKHGLKHLLGIHHQ